MSSSESGSTTPLSFNFENFFPHLILHPEDTAPEEKWKSWVASIVIGIFTAGLVHFGCWIRELSLKDRDIQVKTPEDRTAQDNLTGNTAHLILNPNNGSQATHSTKTVSVSAASATTTSSEKKEETLLQGQIKIVEKMNPLTSTATPGVKKPDATTYDFGLSGWEFFEKEVDKGLVTDYLEYPSFFSNFSFENKKLNPNFSPEDRLIRCSLSAHKIPEDKRSEFLTKNEIFLPQSFLSSQNSDLPISMEYLGYPLTIRPGESLSLEDGSPLPFAPDDTYVHLQIFNPTPELVRSKINYLCLLLPKSFLIDKKQDDLIRLQYNGQLIELKINQVPAKALYNAYCDDDEIWELDESNPAQGTNEAFQTALHSDAIAYPSKEFIPYKHFILENKNNKLKLSQIESTDFNSTDLGQTVFQPTNGKISYTPDQDIHISLDFPGLPSEDLEIFYKNHQLVFIGKKDEMSGKKMNFSVELSSTFKSESIDKNLANSQITLEHGVLNLTIPVGLAFV